MRASPWPWLHRKKAASSFPAKEARETHFATLGWGEKMSVSLPYSMTARMHSCGQAWRPRWRAIPERVVSPGNSWKAKTRLKDGCSILRAGWAEAVCRWPFKGARFWRALTMQAYCGWRDAPTRNHGALLTLTAACPRRAVNIRWNRWILWPL